MAEIIYGVTHCPHCELPIAPEDAEIDVARFCYGAYEDAPCTSHLGKEAHLIAVLQERDVLRAELAQVHHGQLSLLAVAVA